MRDYLLALIVFGSLPFILARVHIGIMMWAWLGYMNPHRLAYGFAFSFPFSQVIAAVTLVAALFSREKKSLPWHSITFFWIALVIWMNISTLNALIPVDAIKEWDRTMKIMLMILLTLMFIRKKEQIEQLVLVIALSLGFLGARGGAIWLASGGSGKTFGPVDSFIGDNNSFGLALVMTVPLLRYLQVRAKNKYISWGYIAIIGANVVAILSTFSRGALLASTAMALFISWNSKYRVRMIAALIVAAPLALSLMPDSWWARMGTIQTYEQDASAMGRINAWTYAFNLALDHPLTGGGFQCFDKQLFYKYAPNPEDFHDAHSIYFEMLAENGFVGLFLFLGLGASSFFAAGKLKKMVRDKPELEWAGDLGAMLQVSLVGYAVGGAFLGLSTFDFFYHLCALVAVTFALVKAQMNPQAEGAAMRASFSAGQMK